MIRAILAVLLASIAVTAHAEGTQLVSTPSSSIVLLGSSNVTDWRCTGTSLVGRMDVPVSLDRVNAAIDRVGESDLLRLASSAASFPMPRFELKVPVDSLRCGNRRMEADMERALRSNEHPVIDFRFVDLVSGIRRDAKSGRYTATISGTLELAGTRKRIEVPLVGERLSRNRFHVSATLPLKMTDFRITPPTALFGMVRAADDLVVKFDLVLESA